jgi:hypothetical protein
MWTWLRRLFERRTEEPRPITDAEKRKEKVTKYFQPTPLKSEETTAKSLRSVGGFFILLGLALLVVGLPGVAVVSLIVGLAIVVHGSERLARYRRDYDAAEPKPKDWEMDDLLKADLHKVADRALHRLNLTKEELELTSAQADPSGKRLAEQGSGPLTVFGPVLTAKQRLGEPQTDKDKADIWRFSAYEVMVICPTRDHLGIYECVLDVHTGARRNEEVREYYYADVVMVSLVDQPVVGLTLHPLDREGHSRAYVNRLALCELQIAVSSGDRSAIVASVNPTGPPRRTVTLPESNLDRVIEALRRLLRVKKRWAS